ncbi:unnamed protein product [Zymoseptoria tritici ST99CH_1A5]|uniref:Fumarylacetoacetase-like C-terminal domain-containing protein n=2 Tax=Zymoseptoria tritici TaxID=1047171 RepID=A0A2H1GH97_ZYMTR|nr:unnamed protein product [Zymoseptoria tritici ST99CH_1E4]SMY24676.1 unnamed protein product [Zymoseptoria tritici ST99CH_1A5]
MEGIASWNRLVRFVAVEDHLEHIGEPIDPDLDIGDALSTATPVKVRITNSSSPLDLNLTFTSTILTIASLLSPISRSEIGTIRCIGLNYHLHAKEMSLPIPTYPSLFFKPATALGCPSAPLIIPHQATDEQADYEAELAFVIGKTCRNVCKADAERYILGYMCSNDVTARKWQFAGGNSQWGYGKGFDGFAPMGPCLVSSRKIKLSDVGMVEVRTEVNGEVLQNGRGDDMIFGVAEVVEHLSRGTTLEAGTVVMLGTPPGIGVSRVPPRWLKDGDEVRIVGSHGLGSLVNRVVYEKGPEDR